MRAALLRHREPGTQLHAGGSHEKQVGAHAAGRNAAPYEHGHIGDVKEHLLKQDRQSDVPHMASGLHSLQDQGICAVGQHALRYGPLDKLEC